MLVIIEKYLCIKYIVIKSIIIWFLLFLIYLEFDVYENFEK